MAAITSIANHIDVERSKPILSNMAASDAKHDFDDEHGNWFSRIFFAIMDKKKSSTGKTALTQSFKKIGTITTPENAWDTWETLYEITKLKGKEKSDLVVDSDFTDKLIGRDEVTRKAQGKKIETIKLLENFKTEYQVKSAYIGYKLANSKTTEYDGLKSAELFKMIIDNYGKDHKEFFCQQDMSVISWDEYFRDPQVNPPRGPEKAKTIYFVNSREGQNDPAPGKMSLDSNDETFFGNKTISLKNQQETATASTTNVVYPAFALNEDTQKSLFQNFNSIYNLQVGPILTNGTVKQVSLSFLDKDQKNICTLNNGKTENAKHALSKRLDAFFSFLSKLKRGGAENDPKENNNYFTALQQKRGGDWLQVLCIYHKPRFGISAEIPFLLITHDVICLAYALAMGVDVIFTRQVMAKSKKEEASPKPSKGKGKDSEAAFDYYKYAVFFQNKKRVSGTIASELEAKITKQYDNISYLYDSVQKYYTNYKTERDKVIQARVEKAKAKAAEIQGSYTGTSVVAAFSAAISARLSPDTIVTDVRQDVRDLFTVLFEYSLINSLLPTQASIQTPLQTATGYTEEDFVTSRQDDLKAEFRRLKDDLPVKINSLVTKQGKTDGTIDLIKIEIKQGQTTLTSEETVQNNLVDEITQMLSKLEAIENALVNMNNFYSQYQEDKSPEALALTRWKFDLTRLKKFDILGTKTKSKNITEINSFLKSLDPFPSKKTGGIIKAIANRFDTTNEKNKQDYSVLNYFTGSQLEYAYANESGNLQTEIVGRLTAILAKITSLKSTKAPKTQDDLATARGKKPIFKRLEQAETQFKEFTFDIGFYLNPTSGVAKTLDKDFLGKILVEMNEIIENERGEEPPALGGKIFNEIAGEKIFDFIDKAKFAIEDPSKWGKSARTFWGRVERGVPGIGPMDKSFKIAYESFYDIKIYNERDVVIFERIYDRGGGNPEDWKQNLAWADLQKRFPRKAIVPKGGRKAKIPFQEEYKAYFMTRLFDTFKKFFGENKTDPSTWATDTTGKQKKIFLEKFPNQLRNAREFTRFNDFLVERYIWYHALKTETPRNPIPTSLKIPKSFRDTFEEYEVTQDETNQLEKEETKEKEHQKKAEAPPVTPLEQEKYVSSTPYNIYLNLLLAYYKSSINRGQTEEKIGTEFFKKLGEKVRAGGARGGARESIGEYEIPYDGFATLYLHQSDTLGTLNDLKSIQDGWDFDYLAEKSQLLASFQEAVEPTVEAITTEKNLTSTLEMNSVYYSVSKQCNDLLKYILPNRSALNESLAPIQAKLTNMPEWFCRSLGRTNQEIFDHFADEDLAARINPTSPFLSTYLDKVNELYSQKQPLPGQEESLPLIKHILKRSIYETVKQVKEKEEQTKTRIYKDVLISQLSEVTDPELKAEMLEFIEGLTYSEFTDLGFLLDNDLIPGQPAVSTSQSVLRNFEGVKMRYYLSQMNNVPLSYEPVPDERRVTVDPIPTTEDQLRAEYARINEMRTAEAQIRERVAVAEAKRAELEDELLRIANPVERKRKIDDFLSQYGNVYLKQDVDVLKQILYTKYSVERAEATEQRTQEQAEEAEATAALGRGGGKQKRTSTKYRRTRKNLRLKSRRRTHKKI